VPKPHRVAIHRRVPADVGVQVRSIDHAEGIAGDPAAYAWIVVAVGREVQVGRVVPVVAGVEVRGGAGEGGAGGGVLAVGGVVVFADERLGLVVQRPRRAEVVGEIVVVRAGGRTRPVDVGHVPPDVAALEGTTLWFQLISTLYEVAL